MKMYKLYKKAEGMFGIFQSTIAITLNMETDTQNNKHQHDLLWNWQIIYYIPAKSWQTQFVLGQQILLVQ
jgi:hypothetical protein